MSTATAIRCPYCTRQITGSYALVGGVPHHFSCAENVSDTDQKKPDPNQRPLVLPRD